MLFYWVLRDWWQDKIYRLWSGIPIHLSLVGSFFYTNKLPATVLSHIYQLYLMVWALPLCVTDTKGLKQGKRMKAEEHPETQIVSQIANIFLQGTAILGV